MIPFQDLGITNSPLSEAFTEAAGRVIRSGRYVNGPEIREFEKELAAVCHADFCVAVSTGLDALRLILLAYMELGRLSEGDEVIVPANTFIATFLAVTACGLTAVAADVDETTACLDLKALPLSERTRAVIPVHLYGRPCWDTAVMQELHDRGIIIIEDNAQALGALSPQKGLTGKFAAGSLGDAAAISFYPAKNIGAFGDAGAVLTDDASLAAMVRKLANYGSEEKYRHEVCGFNCRMDELQAALLRVKLPTLPEVTARRNRVAELYGRLITNPEVVKPAPAPSGGRNVWHQYVIRHPHRDALRRHLAEKGVSTEIHYPVCCHLQPCYKDNPRLKVASPLPAAERLAGEILSLPIADVSDAQATYIANLINSFKYVS